MITQAQSECKLVRRLSKFKINGNKFEILKLDRYKYIFRHFINILS